MTRPGSDGPHDIQIVMRGEFPPHTDDYAATKLRTLLRQSPEPVLYARVTISRHADPAVPRPVVVQVNVDLNGRQVRVRSDGVAVREAIDAAQAKLRRRLPEFARHWEARRGRHRMDVVSRSSVGDRETVDEAVVQISRLGYRFYLFTESSSGQDSVLYRAGPRGYRLAQVDPAPARLAPKVTRLSMGDQPAPRLSVAEAAERLDRESASFLFFAESENGRGCVMYRRGDGQYGLVTSVA
jgi:ribosome-associated translation inhibitor RaiA